jgi:predicted glycoside hydrolase/deacetylase ChbG (UPF0249 family)
VLVIINADDLGTSQGVNDATFELISGGLISSATIMANGPCLKDVAQRTRQFPQISFGIHLNITALSPLSSNDNLKAILDHSGNFIEIEHLLKSSITVSLSNAIYSEFCSQVEKLLSMGIEISHIDSHEHIHTIPRLFPVVKRVQIKYGIKKIRISRNIYLPDYKNTRVHLFKKKLFNFMLRHIYSSKTTTGFCNLTEFYENAKNKLLIHESIEIMVHPGSIKFEDENRILKPCWYKDIPIDFKLINYNQL